jgi:hypothetical protein
LGIQKLQPQNGSDWSKYTPFSKTIQQYLNANQTMSVLSITGKGYLSQATFKDNTGYIGSLKITVDGTIIHWGKYQAAAGLLQENSINYNSNNAILIRGGKDTSSQVGVTNGFDYPYTLNSVTSIVVLPQPIFFNKSLVIELTNENASSTTTALGTIVGGLG